MTVPFLNNLFVAHPTNPLQYSIDGTNVALGDYHGAGSPEGAQVAGIGSTYRDRTAGDLWMKQTGTGNTGWTNITLASVNLGYTPSAADGTVTNSAGNDATLPLGTTTNAGLMSPAQFDKLGFITVTANRDLDAIATQQGELVTLSGVPANSTELGTFTGTTIADNLAIKPALQALETAVEGISLTADLAYTPSATQGIVTNTAGNDATLPAVTTVNAGLMVPADKDKVDFISVTNAVDLDVIESNQNNLVALTGQAAGATDFGAVFTGNIIPDGATITSGMQALETAVEALPNRVQAVVATFGALPGTANTGDIYFVTDAQADPTVDAGSAGYIWNGASFTKFSEGESLDVATDLAIAAQTTTTLDVTSSTGTAVTLPQAVADSATGAADGTAGLLSSADQLKLNQTNSFAADIGDGATTAIAVAHNIGSQDAHINVYRIADGVQVYPTVARNDANNATITFAVAPAAASYRVSVNRVNAA